MSWLLSIGLLIFSGWAKDSTCEDKLIPGFELHKVWEGEDTATASATARVNSALVLETTEFFLRKKRVPFEDEIFAKLKKNDIMKALWAAGEIEAMDQLSELFGRPGVIPSIEDALAVSARELGFRYQPLREKAAQLFMNYLKQHLRAPSVQWLVAELKLLDAPERAERFLSGILGSPDEFYQFARDQHPTVQLDVETKILRGFLRAMHQRDRPQHLVVEPTRPKPQEVLMALTRNQSNKVLLIDYAQERFSLEDMELVLGVKTGPPPTWQGYTPKLFEGLADVEARAKTQFPAQFNAYLPELIENAGRMAELKTWLERKGGALLTSATPGVPIVKEQMAVMEKMAEEFDYPIVVLLTAGRLTHLPEELLSNPRVFVLTHTIENDFFKLWSIRIPPKNQNPLASLDKFKQFLPGQTVFVGHSQQALRVIPTGSNHLRQAMIWATGSLSRDLYPFKLPIQDRTSNLAKNFHTNGFLIAQKADARSGDTGQGVQNVWHVKPIKYVDDRDKGGQAGVTTMGRRYTVNKDGAVSVSRIDPVAIVQGDLHEWVADQRMMRLYRSVLERFPGLKFVIPHDKLDGFTHNRHEFDKAMTQVLIDKYRSGGLDLHRELMGQVQFVNAGHDINPNLLFVLPDDNHGYWLNKLIDNQPIAQQIMNGELLAELTFAKRVLHMDPLEYFLVYRRKMMGGLPPDKRDAIEASSIFVSQPEKVKVLSFGQPFVIGPDYRPVHLNFHGHQGSNGAKSSPNSHAAGSFSAITGDSHVAAMLGRWVSVGTSTPKKIGYNDGGYSSWTNSFAFVYDDGTIELLTYDSLSGQFEAREGAPISPPDRFFGRHELKIQERDNDILPIDEIEDQHSLFTKGIRETLKD